MAFGGGIRVLWTLFLVYLIHHFFFLSLSPWETVRYRINYCFKGPLNPKQPINQSKSHSIDQKQVHALLSSFYPILICHLWCMTSIPHAPPDPLSPSPALQQMCLPFSKKQTTFVNIHSFTHQVPKSVLK